MDKNQLADKFIVEKWRDPDLEIATATSSLRVAGLLRAAFIEGYNSRDDEILQLQEEISTLKKVL